jgi:K+-transporting ATPase ATPase C chain
MVKLFIQSLRLTLLFTVLLGLAYPLAITGIARAAFREKAGGSLIRRDGKAIGSALLAQKFESPRYFWPRPSSCDYATVPSGGSNLGPTSQALRSNVIARARVFRSANGLPSDAPLPADMLFASGSGLDPHISPEAARLQVGRVAAARHLDPGIVDAMVAQSVELPQLGFLGESRVNVLSLNLALDGLK